MEYVRLGASGLKVSQICMGTMTMGREATEQEAFDILDVYREAGGNFLDTADGYSKGESERIVGKWIKERKARSSTVLATKVYSRMGEGPNDGGLSRYHIMAACEASLQRLGVDVIDIYQIHRWDPDTPPAETIDALDDLVRAGKIRYASCSNLKAWHLQEYLRLSENRGKCSFVSIQPLYNALNRSIENEVLPLCDEKGIGVIPYNPLAGGMLTGKYRKGMELPANARMAGDPGYRARYVNDDALDIVEDFIAAAESRGTSPARLALAWCMGDARITCPILGARNKDQLQDSLKGLDLVLSPEERAAIPAVMSGRWIGLDPIYDRK